VRCVPQGRCASWSPMTPCVLRRFKIGRRDIEPSAVLTQHLSSSPEFQYSWLARSLSRTQRAKIRAEHIKHTKCRQEFLDRGKSNDTKKFNYKANGSGASSLLALLLCPNSPSTEGVLLKRQPGQPRGAYVVSTTGENAPRQRSRCRTNGQSEQNISG